MLYGLVKRIKFICCVILLVSTNPDSYSQTFATKKLALKAIFYDLDIYPDFEHSKLKGICELTIRNTGSGNTHQIPLLLYRLMRVTSIRNSEGNPIHFAQQVMSFEDFDLYQANYIDVTILGPIRKNGTVKLIIEYDGYLKGYTETGMAYVQDKIGPEFTILRPDCLAYPVLGYPNEKVNRAAGFSRGFNYKVTVHVPDSLFVANGGKLIDRETANGISSYTYNNISLAWRIDIAIARYRNLEQPPFKIFYLEKDTTGAKTVMRYLQRCFVLFTKWWGPLKEQKSFSVIELPDGYGSQADVSSILQTADAFNDSNEMRQLYHEISHLWNVPSNDVYDPRWNEGLATFIEYLTIEQLENRPYLDYVTDWFLKSIKEDAEKDKKLASTTMINFGKEDLTSYSYSVGMMMFRVLYEVVGNKEFHTIIRSWYDNYYLKGATTVQFMEMANKNSPIKLDKFFYDWVNSTGYLIYIQKGLSISDIIKLYRD
jgi:hypothetical protein